VKLPDPGRGLGSIRRHYEPVLSPLNKDNAVAFSAEECRHLQHQNRSHQILPPAQPAPFWSFSRMAALLFPEGNVAVYSAKTDNHQIFTTGRPPFLGFSPDSEVLCLFGGVMSPSQHRPTT
jgi:hypothetical protein